MVMMMVKRKCACHGNPAKPAYSPVHKPNLSEAPDIVKAYALRRIGSLFTCPLSRAACQGL
jgi:hypothetical protein